MSSEIETTPKYNDYFNEHGYYTEDSSVITLIMGAPGTKMRSKCADYFHKASQHRLEREKENGYLFQYGPSLGDWEFSFQLSNFLTRHYGHPVCMKNIMVTAGASQGLHMCASLFFKKGDTVFVEDPTYFIGFKTLSKDLQLNVVPISMDSDGIDLKCLEDNINKNISKFHTDDRMFSAMVYVIPVHHNPLGICYSADRCNALVKLATKYNLLIFCDDVYNLLSYSTESNDKPLFYYDKPNNSDDKGYVISNCTFSKLLGPGLRLGWLQAKEDILAVLRSSGLVESGGCLNNFTSGILASVIELGFLDEIVLELKKNYADRLMRVCQILRAKLPEGCSFQEPKGGFFLWIELPADTNAEAVLNFAKTHYDVSALPGNRCSVAGNFKNCIRIAFTYQEEQLLFQAVGRLCEAVSEYLKSRNWTGNR